MFSMRMSGEKRGCRGTAALFVLGVRCFIRLNKSDLNLLSIGEGMSHERARLLGKNVP